MMRTYAAVGDPPVPVVQWMRVVRYDGRSDDADPGAVCLADSRSIEFAQLTGEHLCVIADGDDDVDHRGRVWQGSGHLAPEFTKNPPVASARLGQHPEKVIA